MNCILPRAARKTDFGTLCLLSCLWMTASMRYTLFSGVATPETALNGYYYVRASWVPYHIDTTWFDHSVPL